MREIKCVIFLKLYFLHKQNGKSLPLKLKYNRHETSITNYTEPLFWGYIADYMPRQQKIGKAFD